MSIVEILPNNGLVCNQIYLNGQGGIYSFAYNSTTINNVNIPAFAFNGYVLVLGSYCIYHFDSPVLNWSTNQPTAFSIPYSNSAKPSNGNINSTTAFGTCNVQCNDGTTYAACMTSSTVGANYITCTFTKIGDTIPTGGFLRGSFVVNLN